MITVRFIYRILIAFSFIIASCTAPNSQNTSYNKSTKTASQILGDSNCMAICYGGYRHSTRDSQPSLPQIKEDMQLLSAMGIKILRTYNTKFQETENILKAITALRKEDSTFEMYVMLGAWINCKNAWTELAPNHEKEDLAANKTEIQRAVQLANEYPEIVKIISVGNEARVKWATNYYVQTKVILRWVNHLQQLKKEHKLDSNLWITSSDNYAAWGGDSIYHNVDLEALVKAVDFVSLHTYPMHDTHYNPEFWNIKATERGTDKTKTTEKLMQKAVAYAQKQYNNSVKYIHGIDSTKQVHIGETGWASISNGLYGTEGSKACDEYKAGIYYKGIRQWTKSANITCFYFEAFDEKWKDAKDPEGSENHFGLMKMNGEAKYGIWELVNSGAFKGLTRNGKMIQKTHEGNVNVLVEELVLPPSK